MTERIKYQDDIRNSEQFKQENERNAIQIQSLESTFDFCLFYHYTTKTQKNQYLNWCFFEIKWYLCESWAILSLLSFLALL